MNTRVAPLRNMDNISELEYKITIKAHSIFSNGLLSYKSDFLRFFMNW